MYKRTGKVLASLLSVSMLWGNLIFAAPATLTESSSQLQTASNESSTISSDITSHWAKETIERWSARGIVNGVSTGKFEPDRAVTRSEWVSMLNRIFQLQSDKKTAFKDVPSDKWYAADVSTAVYGGYIQGFTDGTFKPEAPLSRAEAASTITKLLKLPAPATEAAFKDQKSIKDWSKSAINAAVEQGIITGYSNHTFQPGQALTRAEAIPVAGFMEQGKSYDIKLVADAITTTNGEKNTQYESKNHRTITKLRMVSPVQSGSGYQIKIKAGDILTFTVTDPDTVYFLPVGISGTKADFDKKVQDQWGKKLEVDASMVNQHLELDTSSLPPGMYVLQAWMGTVFYFTIE